MSINNTPLRQSLAPCCPSGGGVDIFAAVSEIEVQLANISASRTSRSQVILVSFSDDSHDRLLLQQFRNAFDEAECTHALICDMDWVQTGVELVTENRCDETLLVVAITSEVTTDPLAFERFLRTVKSNHPHGRLHIVAVVSEQAQLKSRFDIHYVVQLHNNHFAVDLLSVLYVLAGPLAPCSLADVDWYSMTGALGKWENPSFLVEALWKLQPSELVFESTEAKNSVRKSNAVIAVPQAGPMSFTAARELPGLLPLNDGVDFVYCYPHRLLLSWNGPTWAVPVRMLCRL